MNKTDYDEPELFKRKNEFQGYSFCPRCGGRLEKAVIDNRKRLKCPSDDCDFIYYHNPVPAAGAIIVRNGEILLVKRAVFPKIGWWCLPAGFMEWAEHPRQTTIREVKEETGLDIKLNGLFDVYSGDDDPRLNAVLILYLAEITGGEITPDDDAQDVAFFNLDKLPDKIAFEAHFRAIDDYKQKYSG
jgi:ADP-ribose pyrophosphatase YjhB (NUDIX family)